MSEVTTNITGVRTVVVPVSDQDRALDFYVGTLGFEKRLDATYGSGQRWIEVAPPGSVTSIALAPPGPEQSCGIDTGIRFTTADADADHSHLKASGVDVDPEVTRWPNVPPMFVLRDPDGNKAVVVEHALEETHESRGGRKTKRFAVLVKSDAATESGTLPDQQSLAEMGRFNDELVDAGLMLAGEGLHPSSEGARVVFSGGSPHVIRGPFPEPTALVAGYWLIRAASLDEAIDWMVRAPLGDTAEVEIRQVFEAEEFGEAFTPELREQEERQRVRMEANAKRRAA